MKSIFNLLLVLILCGTASIVKAQTVTRPLIADRYHEIGSVVATKSGNWLSVAYYVTDVNWSISKTNVHVAGSKAGIPSQSGNCNVNSFDYINNHDFLDTVIIDSIDVTGLTDIYVAANAAVKETVGCEMSIDSINASVPNQVFMRLTLTVTPNYFTMLVYDFQGSPIYSGQFVGNCVDLENPIQPGVNYYPYAVSTYSSDTALLSCIIDKPGNLDIVNYIINQPYKQTLNATGKEIQAAIWTLIDDDTPVNGAVGITWNQTIVNQIIADAIVNGEGYVPQCNEYFAVLLDQGCTNNNSNVTVQQSIFWLPVKTVPGAQRTTTGECSNAWAKGDKFANGGWGMFFKF